jgi:hypothetical protein
MTKLYLTNTKDSKTKLAYNLIVGKLDNIKIKRRKNEKVFLDA